MLPPAPSARQHPPPLQFLLPCLTEELPPGLAHVMQHKGCNDDAGDVGPYDLKVGVDDAPVSLQVAKGTLHQYMGPAQAPAEMFLAGVQLAGVGQHESEEEQVDRVPSEEGQDCHLTELEVQHPWHGAPALHQGCQGGVLEHEGTMGTVRQASAHIGEGARVVDVGLQHNKMKAQLAVVVGLPWRGQVTGMLVPFRALMYWGKPRASNSTASWGSWT